MARRDGRLDAARLAIAMLEERHGDLTEDVVEPMCRILNGMLDQAVNAEAVYALLDETWHQATNTAGCCDVRRLVG